MNFNINLKLDKAMDKLSESRTLRVWTYVIGIIIFITVLVMNFGEISIGIADLVRALNGR